MSPGPDYHAWTHRPKAQGGTDPIEIQTGLPYCSWRSNSISVGGSLSSFDIFNLNPATAPAIYSNDSRLLVVNDSGKTPSYGITIPQNALVRIITSIQLFGGSSADGTHTVSWVRDSAYTSVQDFGPIPSTFYSSATGYSPTGLVDDGTGPRAIFHVATMGRATGDWVVGGIHEWENWTDDPSNFKYGISVEILGDMPVSGGP